MRLEYFEDPSVEQKVILLYDLTPGSVAQLRELVNALADGTRDAFEIGEVPGIEFIDGCTFDAAAGASDTGVESLCVLSFRCTFTREGWRTVHGLLEPFAVSLPKTPTHFQYLSDGGDVTWIISTAREW